MSSSGLAESLQYLVYSFFTRFARHFHSPYSAGNLAKRESEWPTDPSQLSHKKGRFGMRKTFPPLGQCSLLSLSLVPQLRCYDTPLIVRIASLVVAVLPPLPLRYPGAWGCAYLTTLVEFPALLRALPLAQYYIMYRKADTTQAMIEASRENNGDRLFGN